MVDSFLDKDRLFHIIAKDSSMVGRDMLGEEKQMVVGCSLMKIR